MIKHFSTNRQNYEESLPQEWKNYLQDRPQMFAISRQPTNHDIVYKVLATEYNPNVQDSLKSMTNPAKQPEASVDPNEPTQIMPMKLPWDDLPWRVDVTLVNSTISIWGQLIESEHLVSSWDKKKNRSEM